MDTLAIIPARGGSKGLPGKNIRPLAGIPLIGHTIKAAREAGSVHRVIVSTDDEEIATVARDQGAEHPFLRPAELSDDKASGVEVCLHALAYAEDVLNYHPELAVLLQPTSPMRNADDIDAAITLLRDSGADSVVSVQPVTEYPQWMKKMDGENRISPLFDDLEITSARQDLEDCYLLNGAIYLSTAASLKKHGSFYGGDTRGYLMPEERSIDIDTLNDFLMAETLITRKQS